MFIARVVCHCRSLVRVPICISHQNHLIKALTTKVAQPEHVSSATRAHRPLSRNKSTTAKARPKPLKTHTVAVNVGDLFSENSDELSQIDAESDVTGLESESGSDQEEVAYPRNAKTVALASFRSKLANYDGYAYSCEEWKSFEADICSENPELKKSWPALCMGIMLHFGCVELASSLMEYLHTQEGSSPSITTLSQYIALQGMYGTDSKEQIINDCYKKVTEISDVFDSTTAKYLIWGLSGTSRWKETLDLLDMAKITGNAGPSYRSPIIQAAFREGEPEVGFRLLDELTADGHQPQDRVVHEILSVCRGTGSNDLLEKYLTDYVWQYNWCLSPSLASAVELHFTESDHEKWTCKWTNVNTVSGTCHSCKQDLPRIEVSSSDFEALQREFLEKALIGDNVYLKSNPQEVETFCDFMQENAPFDVVLDALNIAFTSKNLSKSRQLREVVHYFARKRHMRVLVLGRAHMLKWSADDMKYIRRHAKTFFTDNISSDDPFCLYAALYSGKHCLFVSRDFMRNHKFNMGLRWKDVFERWQKSRQIFHLWVERNHVSIKMPSQYDCGPVKDEKGWHIPYDDGNLTFTTSTQPVLCLRFKGQQVQRPRRKKDQKNT